MNDHFDQMLRGLGEGTPFPVDWRAYEQEVLRRLAVAQARERRRTWTWTISGTIAGAAAMFLVTAMWYSPTQRPAPHAIDQMQPAKVEQPPQPSPEPSEPSRSISQTPAALATAAGEMDDVKPYTRRIVRKDGRVAEIRFEGFSNGSSGSEQSSFITVSDQSQK
jgi:hypothetical protein